MIVDDNATNRTILERHLRSWGMDTASAEDGVMALETLRAGAVGGEPYHVVLVDMQMPGMDGLTLARLIKADLALTTTPVVLLTSLGRPDERPAAGIAATLVKPIRRTLLYDCLLAVIGHRQHVGPIAVVTQPDVPAPALQHARAVLLVEDNAINRHVAQAMLQKLGYQVDVATNGQEAIDAAARVSYAAVLMDCQMPVVDGYAATATIRQQERAGMHTPIIAMTAHALQGDREHCLAVGMDDYLAKPVRLETLAETLTRWTIQPDHTSRDEGSGEEPGKADEEVLDPSVLAALHELQIEDQPHLVHDLIDIFLRDVPQRLALLDDAVIRKDAAALEQGAHTLRGSCSIVGALELARICQEIEALGSHRNIPAATIAVLSAYRAFERVSHALPREREH